MQYFTSYNFALFFHLLGLVLLAGGLVVGYLIDQKFWKLVVASSPHAAGYRELLMGYPKIIQAGSLVTPLSGIWLLGATGWAYWGTFWVTAKVVLFVVLLVNGIVTGGGLGRAIGRSLANYQGNTPELEILEKRQQRFFVLQAVMLALVIFFGVFKPL